MGGVGKELGVFVVYRICKKDVQPLAVVGERESSPPNIEYMYSPRLTRPTGYTRRSRSQILPPVVR